MKRRIFIKSIVALLAAPVAFVGAKKAVPLKLAPAEFGTIGSFRIYNESLPVTEPLSEGVTPTGRTLGKTEFITAARFNEGWMK